MIDNDKRAHDLAITAVKVKMYAITMRDRESAEFDLYQMYMDAYNEAIAKFNRDFKGS